MQLYTVPLFQAGDKMDADHPLPSTRERTGGAFQRNLRSDLLSKVFAEHQKDWDEHLQTVLFAYRTAVHDTTGFTPFSVTFVRSPTLPVDVILGHTKQDPLPHYVQKLQRSVKAAFYEVCQRLVTAHQHQKKFAEAHSKPRSEETQFQIGDIVWLYTPAVKSAWFVFQVVNFLARSLHSHQ